MSQNYMCPKCKGYLSVGGKVVFSVTRHDNQSGIVFLSPTLGDYSMVCHPSCKLMPGEKVSFYCPICHHRLASKKHTNLAMILMVEENGDVFELLFSEITGEQCTVQVSGDKFRLYGEHSKHYKEFLDLMHKSHPYRNL